jgi:ferredoxin-NADP reductase
MPIEPWRVGKVIAIEQAAPSTRSFFIQVNELEQFNFKPGQFVTLDLPIHEKPNKRWRSYSIASCPNGTNIFELVIVLLEGGLGTTYLFNEVTVGSELSFRGAQGVFTLPETLEKDLYFICTGTGIAPFRSMALDIYNKQIVHKNIHLIFGCRTKADLLYYEELSNLQKALPGFHYWPVLSREDWEGYKGYVHQVYEELCKDKPEANFYLCGWKNMIDEAKERIVALGYDKKSIHQEVYG